jgi:hypothetical protein
LLALLYHSSLHAQLFNNRAFDILEFL